MVLGELFVIETRELISIKIHETLAYHIGGETLTLFLRQDRKILSSQHFYGWRRLFVSIQSSI